MFLSLSLKIIHSGPHSSFTELHRISYVTDMQFYISVIQHDSKLFSQCLSKTRHLRGSSYIRLKLKTKRKKKRRKAKKKDLWEVKEFTEGVVPASFLKVSNGESTQKSLKTILARFQISFNDNV